MKKITLPVLLVVTFSAIHWLPHLFTRGMFMDGVFHALFAHNFALGIGSFWNPQTADYMHPDYWDNPQLSGYFLSLWYKAFGDHYWVEKLYSLACGIIQLLLIAALWKIYFIEKGEIKKYAWLPCLLFLIIPLTSWCYSSNLMENAMSIFTTGAVIAFVIYLRKGRNYFLPCAVTGGILVFLGLLTKGPVALFPLATPILFAWVEKDLKWTQMQAYVIAQAITTAVIFPFVFSTPEANLFLRNYLDVQLIRALSHETGTGVPHYTIFIQLLVALSPLLIAALVSLIIGRKKEKQEANSLFPIALAFLLIGLSASVPIALSAKQNKHYLLPALPVFATGFACLILPLVTWLSEKFGAAMADKISTAGKFICVVIVAFCGYTCINNAGGYSRDEVLLRDIDAIQALVKTDTVIRADWKLYDDWALRVYLNRFYDKKICMPMEDAQTHFYITKTNAPGYEKLAPSKIYSGKMYDLYRLTP